MKRSDNLLNASATTCAQGIGTGNDHALYPRFDCCKAVFDLRQHASRHNAFDLELFETRTGDKGNHTLLIRRIGQHSGMFKAIYQSDLIVWCQSFGYFAGYRIGIGIEQLSLAIVGQRSQYGSDSSFD